MHQDSAVSCQEETKEDAEIDANLGEADQICQMHILNKWQAGSNRVVQDLGWSLGCASPGFNDPIGPKKQLAKV
jgi:hypothetical protein